MSQSTIEDFRLPVTPLVFYVPSKYVTTHYLFYTKDAPTQQKALSGAYNAVASTGKAFGLVAEN